MADAARDEECGCPTGSTPWCFRRIFGGIKLEKPFPTRRCRGGQTVILPTQATLARCARWGGGTRDNRVLRGLIHPLLPRGQFGPHFLQQIGVFRVVYQIIRFLGVILEVVKLLIPRIVDQVANVLVLLASHRDTLGNPLVVAESSQHPSERLRGCIGSV